MRKLTIKVQDSCQCYISMVFKENKELIANNSLYMKIFGIKYVFLDLRYIFILANIWAVS